MTSRPDSKTSLFRLGRAVWVGMSYGLAVARLLYEAEPVRFAPLGGIWPSLALGGLGVLIAAGAAWLMSRKAAGGPAAIPVLLVWLYLLAPPGGLPVRPVPAGMVLIGGAVVLSWVLRMRGMMPVWAGSLAVGGLAWTAYLLFHAGWGSPILQREPPCRPLPTSTTRFC